MSLVPFCYIFFSRRKHQMLQNTSCFTLFYQKKKKRNAKHQNKLDASLKIEMKFFSKRLLLKIQLQPNKKTNPIKVVKLSW